jgi:deaminated glutathione amidase
MSKLPVALVQMRSSRDPADNLATCEALVREAAARGARYIQTPEMTNILERSRDQLLSAIRLEADDGFLTRSRQLAADLGVTLHLGSIALKRADGQVVNRAFVIGPDGAVISRYDKVHMFDVDLAGGESWRESATYTAGSEAVIADIGPTRLGLAICYDIRFPKLFRAYAHAGAQILTAPAAFTAQTGRAHWHVLQRARAIENGAFVLSSAQTGLHADGRETYGHSLIVNPWGEVVAEASDDQPMVIDAVIDLDEVAAARARIPALKNERQFVLRASGALKSAG